MEYISVTEFADRHGIPERTARNYCATGKIEGAFLVGKTWGIPADAELPARKQRESRITPLLAVLREQKSMGLKGGIYHRTQIDLTYIQITLRVAASVMIRHAISLRRTPLALRTKA